MVPASLVFGQHWKPLPRALTPVWKMLKRVRPRGQDFQTSLFPHRSTHGILVPFRAFIPPKLDLIDLIVNNILPYTYLPGTALP